MFALYNRGNHNRGQEQLMDFLTHWLITMVGAGLLGIIGLVLQTIVRHQARKQQEDALKQAVLDYK